MCQYLTFCKIVLVENTFYQITCIGIGAPRSTKEYPSLYLGFIFRNWVIRKKLFSVLILAALRNIAFKNLL